MNKTATSQSQPSRQQVSAWIHSILPDVPASFRLEQLGKGVIYCRVLNHYFPGIIVINRIIWSPKTEYENMLNLRILQNAMVQLKIGIPVDVVKLSKEKLHDQWTFVSLFYKYLTQSHEETYPIASCHEEKPAFSYFPQMVATNLTAMYAPKRSLEQVYTQNFYQNLARQPFFQMEPNLQQKSYFNASKYSVGKINKQNPVIPPASTGSPNKGKWSVNSHMFQNNLAPIIDRIKQILLKSSHDTEKIRQIKMLLNIPLNEEVVVKIEEDENAQIITVNNVNTSNTSNNVNTSNNGNTSNSSKNEGIEKDESKADPPEQCKREGGSESSIQTREQIKLLEQNQ